MIALGLTGGIGSGKSTVARIFLALGVPLFESDKVGRLLLQEAGIIEQISRKFGRQVIDANGTISRKSLAKIVFADSEKLKELNGIIHPAVRKRFIDWKNEMKSRGFVYVINEAAILFESNLCNEMDCVVTVSAPESVRISRVKQRDGATEEEIMARMSNQMSDSEREKLSYFVIINDGTKAVVPQVLELHKAIMNNKIRR